MAHSLKFDLLMNDAGVRESLQKDKESMEKFGSSAQMSTEQAINFARTIVSAGSSTSNYRKQLIQLTRQIQDLTVNYNSLTDEEKKGEFGQKMQVALVELKKKAGDFKDAVADVQQEILVLASDTPVWDSIAAGIDVASSSLQAIVSVTEFAGADTEKLAAVISKLAAIQNVANAAIKVGNALQAQSNLMVGVRKLQEAALATAISIRAAAETKGTVATKAATVAQAAFNIVAKMNPYVLLATAIIGVGAALFAFVKKSDDAKKAEEERQKQIEESRKKYDDYRDAVAKNSGEMVSSYYNLKSEYGKLKTELEKTKFIKDNASEFNKLGITIKNVADADNVFVNNTDKVVKALELRARAMALQNLTAKAYEEYYKKIINADATVAGGGYYRNVRPGTIIEDSDLKKEDLDAAGISYNSRTTQGTVVEYTTSWYEDENGHRVTELSKAQADKINAYRQRKARETNKRIKNEALSDLNAATGYATKELERLNKEMQNLSFGKVSLKGDGNSPTGNSSNTNSNNNKETFVKGSLAYAQKIVSDLQKKVNEMSPDNPEFEKTNQLLADAKKEVERIKKLLAEAEPRTQAEELVHSYSNAVTEINTILKKVHVGDIDIEEAKKQIAVINDTLQAVGQKPIEISFETKGSAPGVDDQSATTTVNIVANTESLDEVNEKLDNLSDKTVRIDVETTNTTTNVTNGSAPSVSDQSATTTIDFVANTDLLINTYDNALKEIQNIAKQQEIGIIDVETANRSISVINSMLKNLGLKPIVKEIKPEIKEGSLSDIQKKISDIKAKIQVENDPNSLRKLNDELDELENKERTISFRLSLKDAEDAKKELNDIYDSFKSKDLVINFEVLSKSEKAIRDADIIGEKYFTLQSYLKNNEDAFKQVSSKAKELRTVAEQDFYETYIDATDHVNELGKAYEDAAKKANKLQINKLSWEGFKKGVGAIKNVASGIGSLKDSWASLGEQWEDMSPFERTISVIETVCSTFETLISMYEGVTEVIKIFSAISEAASAKKIASNSAEMTSDAALTTQNTINTSTKIANNTLEQTSDAGTIATKQGKAIAGATASGASLPFPANLAAIAAGVAAVVAAIAMIASFENGGIVPKAANGNILGGPTTMGDHTLFYGNGGEMILNTRQQANLFRLIDNGYSNRSSVNGNVEFKIRGKELVGVLSNYNSQKKHV